MGKEKQYLDLGYGAGVVVEEVAKQNLKHQKRKINPDNLHDEMQRVAQNALDSYVPSPILGKNPAKLEKQFKQILSENMFDRMDATRQRNAHMSIAMLTDATMQAMGFKIEQSKTKYSDFEFRKGEVLDVTVNRIARDMVNAYIYKSLTPLINMRKSELTKTIIRMGLDEKTITQVKKKKSVIIKFWEKLFGDQFKKFDLLALLRNVKF